MLPTSRPLWNLKNTVIPNNYVNYDINNYNRNDDIDDDDDDYDNKKGMLLALRTL